MQATLQLVHKEPKTSKKKIRRFFKYAGRMIELFFIANSIYVNLILKQVNYYQPLYHFAILKNKRPQRNCIDRADTVYHAIREWGAGAKVLDIGCSLGFFSHYFADRGYSVDGIDSDKKNISICKQLARLHRKETKFNVDIFSREFLSKVQYGQYDIVFLFNIVHHIIHAKGIDYTKELMRDLLNKIPVLFIELAVKEEEVEHAWLSKLPQHPLDIFELCDDIKIETLGHFSHRMNNVRRPLFKITKERRHFHHGEQAVLLQRFAPSSNSLSRGARYYDCGNLFIKSAFHANGASGYSELAREISNYKVLPKNHFFPEMISYYKDSLSIELVLSKVPGENLLAYILKNHALDRVQVITDVIAALRFLHEQGLYHNDLRVWNINYDNGKIYLLDLGRAGIKESESTLIALQWLILQIVNCTDYQFSWPIIKAPSFAGIALSQELEEILNPLQESSHFKDFISKLPR